MLAVGIVYRMKISFAMRFGIGAGLLVYVIIKSRRFSLVPMAIIFEILGAGIDLLLSIMHALRQKIFWGGITYAR